MSNASELLTIHNGPYTDRITTFIDVLGFTRDLSSPSTRRALILSIEALLSSLRSWPTLTPRGRGEAVDMTRA